MALAETGVDQRDFLANLQAHDVDVERQCIEPLTVVDHGFLHHRTVSLGPHQIQTLAKEHVTIADREGLDLTYLELIDERIGRALHRRRLRSLLCTEAHIHRGEPSQGEGGGAQNSRREAG